MLQGKNTYILTTKEGIDFKDFLMKKFFSIMVFVVIIELFMKMLIDELVVPIIHAMIFGTNEYPIEVSISQVFLCVLFLLSRLVCLVSQTIFRTGPDSAVTTVHCKIAFRIEEELAGVTSSGRLMNLAVDEVIFVLLILLLSAALFFSPIVMAGYVFAHIIIREVGSMECHKEEIQLEYEKLRNSMFSDIAHDVRTPITTIAGYSRALRDGLVPEEKQEEYLEAIENKAKRISKLINLLFEYVKLDSGESALKKTDIDITELLRTNIALLYSDIEANGMSIEVDIKDETIWVEADALQASRVITNLLHNAVQHNDQGTVIKVSLLAHNGEGKIIVGDTGAFLAPEIAEHIFDPFVVGDDSRKSEGGNGMGLSIAKKMVEMHGFDIRYEQDREKQLKQFVITFQYKQKHML